MSCTRASVLIVDDKASIRTTMSLVLGEIGYRVRTAQDGLAALREIRQETPDILLSDLNMPGMSGFELLAVVRRRFPAILVVAMSGSFAGKQVPAGVAADAFFQKGSSLMVLVRILVAPPPMKRPAPKPCRALAPILIPWNGAESSREPQITITCPECLRAFSHAPDDFESCAHAVDCIHCGNSIDYAITECLDQMQDSEHRDLARKNASDPRSQQSEQKHQQKTQQLSYRHAAQVQTLQLRQPQPKPQKLQEHPNEKR